MNKIDFLHNLEDLIETDRDTLFENSVLLETPKWDSLALMGFIAFADEELGVNPRPEDIKSCRTVGDLMALVGNLQ